MTPLLSTGEVIHDPDEMTMGLLADIGWETEDPCITESIYVDKNSFQFIEFGSKFFPCKTIETAIDQAPSGADIFILSSGDHLEGPLLISKNIKISLDPSNTGSVIVK